MKLINNDITFVLRWRMMEDIQWRIFVYEDVQVEGIGYFFGGAQLCRFITVTTD